MSQHITYDPAYNTLDRDDFMGMIEVDRYADRSDAFDEIIAATVDHFWDPLDPSYIDFDSEKFDLDEQLILPRNFHVELNCAVAEKLTPHQQIQLANQSSRFTLSSILHGEQGALSLSASLCQILRDPGAQEYAANQAREEARHVSGFSIYVAKRWGTPLPCGSGLGELLDEAVQAPMVYKKLVGMQMLVEGLAMGAFAFIHANTEDPVLKRLVQLVMADEAFHHRFGKIWADKTIPGLSPEEHEVVEDWAAECFQNLLMNLVNSEQKQVIYEQFGLDWKWVRSAILEAFSDSDRRDAMRESNNIFRVLIKTLLKAGIITERTRPIYAAWVNMKELDAEGDEVIGTELADATTLELIEINRGRKKIGRILQSRV